MCNTTVSHAIAVCIKSYKQTRCKNMDALVNFCGRMDSRGPLRSKGSKSNAANSCIAICISSKNSALCLCLMRNGAKTAACPAACRVKMFHTESDQPRLSSLASVLRPSSDLVYILNDVFHRICVQHNIHLCSRL